MSTSITQRFVARSLTFEEFLGPKCHCWPTRNPDIKLVLGDSANFKRYLASHAEDTPKPKTLRSYFEIYLPRLMKIFWEACQCKYVDTIEYEVNLPYPLTVEEEKEYRFLLGEENSFDEYRWNECLDSTKGLRSYCLSREEYDRLEEFSTRVQEYDRLADEIINQMS